MKTCRHNTDLETEDWCPECSEEIRLKWLKKQNLPKDHWISRSIRCVPEGEDGEFYIRGLSLDKRCVPRNKEDAFVQVIQGLKKIFG